MVYVHQLLFTSDSLTGRQSQETLVAVSQTEAATADEDSEVFTYIYHIFTFSKQAFNESLEFCNRS